MKTFIPILVLSVLLGGVPTTSSASYQDYTVHQLENLSFPAWWKLLKKLAKQEGIIIPEHEKSYWKEYWEEGYFPDEAIEAEFD